MAVPRDAGVLRRGASVGRYLILSQLGRGSMGSVYCAYDPELDRRVALKLLHAAGGSEDARRLLAREARSLGKLSHPNVVQVHDVGEHQGQVFVAMELVDGDSLETWCAGEPRPAWRDVLDAYLDAARGLSAAHAKGLVHRDVKPSNILRGKDGRVRVVDFGLAGTAERRVARDRDAREASETTIDGAATEAKRALLDETLPAHGELEVVEDPSQSMSSGVPVGTPRYMAPEQHLGKGVSAASDQFALCASLYEGLYGEPAFSLPAAAALAHMMPLLLAAKEEGPPPPPPGSPVPVWVHRVIARGLAPAAADRWPSIDALVDALRRDPLASRRARWRAGAAAFLVLSLLALAAAGWARSGVFRDACANPERELAGAWDDNLRERTRATLLATRRSYAESTAALAVDLLDRYAASWASMRGEVCRAAQREMVSREVLAMRAECLDRRRGQLQALTTLLSERADPDVLDRAVQSAAALYPLSSCAETKALTARVRPPEDPAVRARVAAIQPRVDRLEALFHAGKYRDGLALGRALLDETEGLAYAPLRGQVQLWTGQIEDGSGDSAASRTHLREAAISASEGHDDLLGAAAWAQLLYVVGSQQQRFEEAAVLRAMGPTAVARAHDDRALATWLNAEAAVLSRMGSYAEAREVAERALGLWEKVGGPDDPHLGAALVNLANALYYQGDYPRALAIHERVLALHERTLGSGHPYIAVTLDNLGDLLGAMGEYEKALSMDEKALALRVSALGPAHPSVAGSLINLGAVLLWKGDAGAALAAFDRAEAIAQKTVPADHPEHSYTLGGAGRAEVQLGRLEAARAHLEHALAIRESSSGRVHPALVFVLIGLGELHLARRAPAEAVGPLERALTIDDPEEHGDVQLALAEALWALGKDRGRARDLADEARAGATRVGHAPRRARAERWLADHPAGQPGVGR